MNLQARAERGPEAAAGFSVLGAHIGDSAAHWSLGTFGALAEFSRDEDEPTRVAQSVDAISVVTPRGGILLRLHSDMRLFASEGVTKTSWSQRVALCLPESASRMSGRGVLTELGPDIHALRAADRDAILFDLGLDLVQVDACIRVGNGDAVAELRRHAGRPVFEHGNPTMGFILKISPPRVFIGPLGRIEVYNRIPPPDGKSPEGPHTHVLPKLLARRRTHSATEPVPAGYLPCAHLYPPHPSRDGLGREQPFDVRRLDRFQAILREYGNPNSCALKRAVTAAVRRGDNPAAFAVPDGRFARATIRVALRQLIARAGTSEALDRWSVHFDRTHSSPEDDAEMH